MEDSGSKLSPPPTPTPSISTSSYTRMSLRTKIKHGISSIHGLTMEQKFTDQQKAALAQSTSVSYQPTHSRVYTTWLVSNSSRYAGFWSSWDRWFLCFLIGLCVGLVAVLLKQALQALFAVRWNTTQSLIESNNMATAWGWNFGFGALFVIFGSWLVVFVHPPATGGGSVEVMAFLNGIIVHGTLGIRCLVVKLLGNVFAVSSGLPAAIQGPIIAMGAIIGAGVGNFQSKTFNFHPKAFSRLRTEDERRTFTTAGVAAGVAAAFNAPIGGLLFAMEDLSSHWTKRISQQTFFSCIIATAIASLFNTAFTGFRYNGSFGAFTLQVIEPIQVHVASIIPAIILGIIGGLLGAFFTRVNVFLVALRKTWVKALKKPFVQKIGRIFETVILVLIMSCFTVFIPMVFPCQTIPQETSESSSLEKCYYEALNYSQSAVSFEPYTCHTPSDVNASSPQPTQFNGAATLIQGSGTHMLDTLWTRSTSFAFTWQQLLVIFPVWFLMTIWTCGCAISGGIFVPNLVTGALYGRLLGLGLLAIYQSTTGEPFVTNPQWVWIDPGLMAVIGAGSLLAGVTRLGVASTVIVVEMSSDINTIIPVMLANLTAKLIADFLSKPLFKYQMDAKSLPNLEQEPRVLVNGKRVNLELYKARDAMKRGVHAIHHTETIHKLASLLFYTNHSGFPVVKYDETTKMEHLCGIITRKELYVLLCSDEVYNSTEEGAIINPNVPYEELSVDYIVDHAAAVERVRMYLKFGVYHNMSVNLESYLNLSVYKVDEDFSLLRTYNLFRTMGLVNLCVTDTTNRVVGIITRKDLLPFAISEKLSRLDDSGSVNDTSLTQESGITEVNLVASPSGNSLWAAPTSPLTNVKSLPSLKEELNENSRPHSRKTSPKNSANPSPSGSSQSIDFTCTTDKDANTAL